MVDSPAPRNEVGGGPNEFRATGPGGWGLWIRGREGILLLILAGALAALVAMTWKHLDLARDHVEQRTGRQAAIERIARDHRELLCILALTQDERKAAVRAEDVCGYLFGTIRRSDR